jgi:WD40 repeat protein
MHETLPWPCWLIFFTDEVEEFDWEDFPGLDEEDQIYPQEWDDRVAAIAHEASVLEKIAFDPRVAEVRDAWEIYVGDFDSRLFDMNSGGDGHGQQLWNCFGNSFCLYFDREQALVDLARVSERHCFLWDQWHNGAPTVRKLARSVLDGDDTALGILGDALEEAGDPRASDARFFARKETPEKEPVHEFRHDGPIRDLAFSPDGRILAIAGEQGVCRLVDVETGEQQAEWPSEQPSSLALSTDGRLIARGGGVGSITMGTTEDGKSLHTLSVGDGYEVVRIAVSSEGNSLAAAHPARRGGKSKAVSLFDTENGKRLGKVACDDLVTGLAYLPDGSGLVVIDAGGGVRLLDRQGQELGRYAGHTESVACVGVAKGRRFATGGHDNTLRVWDVATGDLVWQAPSVLPRCLAFSADDRVLMSGSYSGHVFFWDAATGERLAEFTCAPSTGWEVVCLAVSPKGSWLATCAGWEVKLWKLNRKHLI